MPFIKGYDPFGVVFWKNRQGYWCASTHDAYHFTDAEAHRIVQNENRLNIYRDERDRFECHLKESTL